jgi:hypothetical protein
VTVPARRATAQDAVPPTVRRAVLEGFARRVAQALHALGDKSLAIPFTVVVVGSEVAEESGIGLARMQQLGRHGIHLPELVIAEDDVQVRVGVHEGTGHVVEGDVQLCFKASHLIIGHDRLLDGTCWGAPRSTAVRAWSVSQSENLSWGQTSTAC